MPMYISVQTKSVATIITSFSTPLPSPVPCSLYLLFNYSIVLCIRIFPFPTRLTFLSGCFTDSFIAFSVTFCFDTLRTEAFPNSLYSANCIRLAWLLVASFINLATTTSTLRKSRVSLNLSSRLSESRSKSVKADSAISAQIQVARMNQNLKSRQSRRELQSLYLYGKDRTAHQPTSTASSVTSPATFEQIHCIYHPFGPGSLVFRDGFQICRENKNLEKLYYYEFTLVKIIYIPPFLQLNRSTYLCYII